jgi:hypothetical protein
MVEFGALLERGSFTALYDGTNGPAIIEIISIDTVI